MSKQIDDREFTSIINLPATQRYSYCLKVIAQFQELWGLWDDHGWALVGDELDRESLPVWPASTYAEAFALGHWDTRDPRRIPLSEWMNNWIHGMESDRFFVNVFPTASGEGFIVPPERFKQDIEIELASQGPKSRSSLTMKPF
jgi:hypothetical protein